MIKDYTLSEKAPPRAVHAFASLQQSCTVPGPQEGRKLLSTIYSKLLAKMFMNFLRARKVVGFISHLNGL